MNSFLAILCVFICFTTTIALFVKNDEKLSSHTFQLGEKRYFIDLNKVNFDDALNFCKSKNLQLVSIENDIENTNIYKQLDEMGIIDSAIWTSGTKLAFSDDWIWLTNMTFIKFSKWRFEPSYKRGTEFCLSLAVFDDPSRLWINEDCEVLNYPLCQTVPSS